MANTEVYVEQLEQFFKTNDSSKAFRQLEHIPSFLISNLEKGVHNRSKIISKYNFIMSLGDFEEMFLPQFKVVENRTFIATFYDVKDENQSLMKRNMLVKAIRYYGKDENLNPEVSIKRAHQDSNGVLLYQETRMDMGTAIKELPIILDFFDENNYEIDVQRTKYVHNNDDNTILTLDRVTYPEDDTSFVVFSLAILRPITAPKILSITFILAEAKLLSFCTTRSLIYITIYSKMGVSKEWTLNP